MKLGAIERSGYTFQPEFSVVRQNGAIHVYHHGELLKKLNSSLTVITRIMI